MQTSIVQIEEQRVKLEHPHSVASVDAWLCSHGRSLDPSRRLKILLSDFGLTEQEAHRKMGARFATRLGDFFAARP